MRHSRSLGVTGVPVTPEKRPVGADLGQTAILSTRSPAGTAEQKAKDDAAEEARQRSAAVQVADKALRDGCGGRRRDGDPGCVSPDHAEHLRQALEDLREAGLAEDPLVKTRYHFGIAPKEGEGG